jgi:hypothetical protein
MEKMKMAYAMKGDAVALSISDVEAWLQLTLFPVCCEFHLSLQFRK